MPALLYFQYAFRGMAIGQARFQESDRVGFGLDLLQPVGQAARAGNAMPQAVRRGGDRLAKSPVRMDDQNVSRLQHVCLWSGF
jgi:hypothetical protein